MVLEFFVKWRGLGFFCGLTTCPNSVKTIKWDKFLLAQCQQNDYPLSIAQNLQNNQFDNLYIYSHEEARNIKFGPQGKLLIQRVLFGNLPKKELTSLSRISNLWGYCYQIWTVKTTL